MTTYKKIFHSAIWISISFLFACSTNTNETSLNKKTSEKPDYLASWNDNATKKAIISYVEDVTNPQSPNFIPVPERIATFDNDGTLWSEQPLYFQLYYAIDMVKTLAPDHPEWKNKEPYKFVLENDIPGLLKAGQKATLEIMMNTHVGMTISDFEASVKKWASTAKHPTKGCLYTELVFQPMLELIDYLKVNDFKVFIVSGGGIEFMRPWAEEVYGIPKNQIIGSSVKTQYDYNNGNPVIKKIAAVDMVDDKEGKPVCINKHIGRKPVFSCGNSDGDLQMMRWADSNPFKSFKLYLHHTDAEREWAYDRDSPYGTFNIALDEATEKQWTIIDMANDWVVVYPFELSK